MVEEKKYYDTWEGTPVDLPYEISPKASGWTCTMKSLVNDRQRSRVSTPQRSPNPSPRMTPLGSPLGFERRIITTPTAAAFTPS